MTGHHITVGIVGFGATLLFFAVKYFRARKQNRLPLRGWVGLTIILLGQYLLFRRLPWVSTFFTPLMWTGYVLLADAMVFSLRGESRLRRAPWQFLSLVFWSVPLWLIFEAYNLRLENWTYVGLPGNPMVRNFGYIWSFATIWPAIFQTADFVRALGLFRQQRKHRTAAFAQTTLSGLCVLGLLLVTVPVAVPVRTGRHLFGAVWVGFILLLDPLNYFRNGHSLLRDWETGETTTLRSFLLSGLVCGVFWEFWNHWACAKWLYIFPIWQGWKVFEMPLPGYLGFPPFALECFVMYEFLRTAKRQLLGLKRGEIAIRDQPFSVAVSESPRRPLTERRSRL